MYKIDTLVDRCYFISKGRNNEWEVSYSEKGEKMADNPMRVRRFQTEHEGWIYLTHTLSQRASYLHQYKDPFHSAILWHFVDLLQKESQLPNPLPYEDKKQMQSFLRNHFQYYRTLSWIDWSTPFPRYRLHIIRKHLTEQQKFYTIQSPSLTKDERNSRLFTEQETIEFLWDNQVWLSRSLCIFPSKEFRTLLKEVAVSYKGIEKRKEGSI